MSIKKINYKEYLLEDVTNKSDLWAGKDPVRPWLSTVFRTSAGRKVYGLTENKEDYSAFLCLALTKDIPICDSSLKSYSSEDGHIAVPYTVWSYKPGAGSEIISRILNVARDNFKIKRVITLSPLTGEAKRFHLKNGAKEYRKNSLSVNFEYQVEE